MKKHAQNAPQRAKKRGSDASARPAGKRDGKIVGNSEPVQMGGVFYQVLKQAAAAKGQSCKTGGPNSGKSSGTSAGNKAAKPGAKEIAAGTISQLAPLIERNVGTVSRLRQRDDWPVNKTGPWSWGDVRKLAGWLEELDSEKKRNDEYIQEGLEEGKSKKEKGKKLSKAEMKERMARMRLAKITAEVGKLKKNKARLEQDFQFRRMDLEKELGTHVALGDIETLLGQMCGKIKGAVEALQRKFGPEVADAMNEALDEFLETWRGSGFGGRAAGQPAADPKAANHAAVGPG